MNVIQKYYTKQRSDVKNFQKIKDLLLGFSMFLYLLKLHSTSRGNVIFAFLNFANAPSVW